MTNLPPQAITQYKKVLASRTPEEKLANLRLYLSLIPKHKGTERLQRQVKRQISELEDEIREKRLRSKKARRRSQKLFENGEGSPLVALLGRTMSGKSSILSRLTSARPRVTGLPYATDSPEVGGFRSGSLVFQIVELPPLRVDSAVPPTHLEILRRCDLVALVVDLEQDLEGQMKMVEELRKAGIYLGLPSKAVKIERRAAGGISVVGESAFATRDEIVGALRAQKIDAAVVKVGPMSTLDDLDAAVKGLAVKPALILANKIETAAGSEKYRELVAGYGGTYKIVGVSALKGTGFDGIEGAFMSTMGLIRVFTKPPSSDKPSERPILIKQGSTVRDLASSIHGELAKTLKYARIWRTGKRIEGLRVGPSFPLEDMDAVELRG
ncbi:MAG: TGS domain-containing protein [Thermoproteota archaeon]